MICNCNNSRIEIIKPSESFGQILDMIATLSDESDMLPFTSEDFGVSEDNLRQYIEGLNNADNSIFLVAYEKQNPIGFAYLEGGRRARTHHCANLGIAVLSEYQCHGIGIALMEQLLAYAETSESIAKIDLQVRRDNKRAIALYKKMNFFVEGVNRRALFVDGEFVDYVMMGRLIH